MRIGLQSAVEAVLRWWDRRGHEVLLAAVAAMAAAALWRLGHALPELLWDDAVESAFDLRLRHREVGRWFGGLEVYGPQERGDYPPASYAFLWPLTGWLDLAHARVLWAATALAGLGWLAHTMVRASGTASASGKLSLALIPFSIVATSATLSLGQVGLHVVPLTLAGVLVLARGGGSLRSDLLAAVLLVPALAKPTLSVPFLWLVLLLPGRLRPMLLVVMGYVGVTVFAILFQEGGFVELALGWLDQRPQVLRGHTNFPRVLALLGLKEWTLPATIAALLAHGWWVARHRRADLWLLLGATALVARLFIHHRLYDDVLVLVAIVPLVQAMRTSGEPIERVVPGILVAACWASLIAPAALLSGGGAAAVAVELFQGVTWAGALIFLLAQARRSRRMDGALPTPHYHENPRRDGALAAG